MMVWHLTHSLNSALKTILDAMTCHRYLDGDSGVVDGLEGNSHVLLLGQADAKKLVPGSLVKGMFEGDWYRGTVEAVSLVPRCDLEWCAAAVVGQSLICGGALWSLGRPTPVAASTSSLTTGTPDRECLLPRSSSLRLYPRRLAVTGAVGASGFQPGATTATMTVTMTIIRTEHWGLIAPRAPLTRLALNRPDSAPESFSATGTALG